MHQIILIAFLITLALFLFYSGLVAYSLLHFGKSKILGLTLSAIYFGLLVVLAVNAFINISAL